MRSRRHLFVYKETTATVTPFVSSSLYCSTVRTYLFPRRFWPSMLDDAAGYNSCSTSAFQWTNIEHTRNMKRRKERSQKRKKEERKEEKGRKQDVRTAALQAPTIQKPPATIPNRGRDGGCSCQSLTTSVYFVQKKRGGESSVEQHYARHVGLTDSTGRNHRSRACQIARTIPVSTPVCLSLKQSFTREVFL